MKRKDNWKPEEDRLLAETVIKHVSQASTQLKAFKEVAERLNRTENAVGFRWNSKVRKEHEKELQEAKQQRKELKQKEEELTIEEVPKVQNSSQIELESLTEEQKEALIPIIQYFQSHNERNIIGEEYEALLAKYQQLEKEYEKLQQKHNRIVHFLSQMQQQIGESTA